MSDLINVSNISISFTQYIKGLNQRELKVITDLTLDIKEGEIVAVLGSSGSGKSLLAHAIFGILPENANLNGKIKYKGKELSQKDKEEIKQCMKTGDTFYPQMDEDVRKQNYDGWKDAVEAVYILKDYIVHTHLKDGKMLKRTDPKIIYDHFAVGGIDGLNSRDFFIETPVGEGDVDLPAYIKALKDIGYDGYLTVERETGADPSADIKKALDYIKDYI